MYLSNFFTHFEVITPEISPTESFNLTPELNEQQSKFVIMSLKLNRHHLQSKLLKKELEPISFFKTFPNCSTSSCPQFSDFSVDRFITKTDSQVTEHKFAICKRTINEIDNILDDYHKILNKYFGLMEEQIYSIYGSLVNQLNESRLKLHNELSSFQQKCINNIKIQASTFEGLKEFLDDHQIDPKTIEFYLFVDHSLCKTGEWLREVEKISDQLNAKRTEFNSFIFMNKNVSFTPTFIDSRCIQQGILNCYDFYENSEVSEQFFRLDEFLLNRDFALVRNSFNIDTTVIDNKSYVESIHSLCDEQKILVVIRRACDDQVLKSEKTTFPNDIYELHTFDLFGRLLKSLTLPSNTVVKHVSSDLSSFVVTHFSPDPIADSYYLTLYTSLLEIVKQIPVGNSTKLIPICSNFKNNFYLLSRRDSVFLSSLPFLHVYDSSLNFLSKLGQSVKPDARFYVSNDSGDLFVNDTNLYLLSAKTPVSCQISIVELSSGCCLKVVQIPYSFDKFYVIGSGLLLFINTNWLICYDMAVEKLKHRTYMQELKENMNIRAYCLTKLGFIVTLDKNIVCIY